MSNTNEELKRLHKDFEVEASKYHNLTLSTYIVGAGIDTPGLKFRDPNHAINLWQYAGPLSQFCEEDAISLGDFGLRGATLTAFAVVEGPKTPKFCRMAKRAGSLLPEKIATDLGLELMRNIVRPDAELKPMFVANLNALAVWINLVLMSICTYQPTRFRSPAVAVDPFTASLAVFDYVLTGRPANHSGADAAPSGIGMRKFKVALSFPGDKREYVAQVAAILRQQVESVFYDRDFEAELAQPNLDTLLQTIFHTNSELVVVFLCAEYQRKEWCGLEWRAIRDLFKRRQSHNVMLLRFDDADIDGVFSTDGFIDLRQRTPQETAELIIQRLGGAGQST